MCAFEHGSAVSLIGQIPHEGVFRGFEIYAEGAALQQLPAAFRCQGSSAERQHCSPVCHGFQECIQGLRFHAAECLFALRSKDFGNRHPSVLFNQGVQVIEIHTKPVGKNPSDRALAASHESCKRDYLFRNSASCILMFLNIIHCGCKHSNNLAYFAGLRDVSAASFGFRLTLHSLAAPKNRLKITVRGYGAFMGFKQGCYDECCSGK